MQEAGKRNEHSTFCFIFELQEILSFLEDEEKRNRLIYKLKHTGEDSKPVHALKEIITKKDEYEKYYIINNHGDYEHLTFQFSCKDYFNLSQFVLDELDS